MRTEMSNVQVNAEGKWAVVFTTYNGPVGQEYVSSELLSASVFDSDEEAIAAGNRALDMLEHTGKFPNLCAKF